jgi:hypothetical protein
MKEVITIESNLLRYASGNLKNNKNFILEIVCVDGDLLQYASVHLQNDLEFQMVTTLKKLFKTIGTQNVFKYQIKKYHKVSLKND